MLPGTMPASPELSIRPAHCRSTPQARRCHRLRLSGSGISNGSGDLNAGHVVTLTLTMSEAVTVNTTGGTPTLTLNDGGNRDLYRRLRQQRADLQLHSGGRSEHA